MANFLFDDGREGFLDGSIDWMDDDIRGMLIDYADDTPSQANDKFVSDLVAGSIVARSGALTGKSATDGVADASDLTFAAVTGDPAEALVLFKHTGSDATARLICKIDVISGGAALVATPNGGDITFQWDNGANKIFKL